jgi:3-methyladenine DNA glycosylase AlkD
MSKATTSSTFEADFSLLSTDVRCDRILSHIRAVGANAHRQSLARLGVPVAQVCGVPTPHIRRLARELGVNQALADSLWQSCIHEARLLAVLIASPSAMPIAAIENWMSEIQSWDLCDHLCNNLLRHMPECLDHLPRWAANESEFVRRAAFATIAMLAIHEKRLGCEHVRLFLTLIQRYACDRRNYVKKAVSWALRELGKRDLSGHQHALALASTLMESTDPGSRWVGKDTLLELKTLVPLAESERLARAKIAVLDPSSEG